MNKRIRKPVSVLLSLLLVLSLACTAVLPAFAEGENWVAVPTSAEGLNAGDYYFDLSGLDVYKEMYVDQFLFDVIPGMNNYFMLGYEYLKKEYPADWADALDAVDHSQAYYEDKAEDLFRQALGEKGIAVDWNSIEAYGRAYVQTAYATEVAEAEDMAQAYIDDLKSLDWYVDMNFANGYRWIKAEKNGQPYAGYFQQEEIADFFTVYGADWQPIQIVESADGLAEGSYYIEKSVLVAQIDAMVTEQYGDAQEMQVPDYETGSLVTVSRADFIEQILASYGDFFINTTAPAGNLFRYKVVSEVQHYSGSSYTMEIAYSLAEYTWSRTAFDTAFFETNVKVVESDTPDDPGTPDAPDDPDTPDTPDGDACPICGKTTHSPKWIGILHLVFAFLLRVFRIVK